MTTRKGLPPRHFVDADGNYLGAFAGVEVDGEVLGPDIPAGAIEVSEPPARGTDRWTGSAWEPVPTVPASVTKLQLVRALRAAGKWGQAKQMIAAADVDAQEDWDLAIAIERQDPLVINMGQQLGMDDETIDRIFTDAARR